MLFETASAGLDSTWYAIALAVLNCLQTIALAYIAARWHLGRSNGSAS